MRGTTGRRAMGLAAAVIAVVALASGPASAQGGTSGGSGGGGSTATCAPTASVKATAGYRPGGGNIGALWTSYTVGSCPGLDLAYDLTQTDTSTGQPILGWSGIAFAGVYSSSFDNDWVALNTTFRVDVVVRSRSTGEIVASATSYATTPKGKNPGTLG